jgi:Cof subfamily protein (haloacid dehalogenase superfamily)
VQILPAMIATDLDGTLLGPDGEVSERTCAAVAAAHEAGIVVVAATGRSRLTALDKLAGCPAIRWVVCSNGAMIWDRADDRMHLHRAIDGPDAVALMEGLREHPDGVGFGWETVDGFGYDEVFWSHRRIEAAPVLVGDVPVPGPDDQVTKLLISHAELLGTDLHRHLAGHLYAGVTVSSSGGPFIEATALGVDKASTLTGLAEAMGIASEAVMAFGDQHNDLEMLTWAGTGIAMGNAHPEVAAAASLVAETHAEDGVAQIIEALLRHL